jgi:hypothetical protein
MSLDTIMKILFGSILMLFSWDFIRRYIKGELKVEVDYFKRKDPMGIFYFSFILGIVVLIIGISELLP